MLQLLALAMGKIAEFSKAQVLIRAMKNNWQRAVALSTIASFMNEAQHPETLSVLEEAESLTMEVEHPGERAEAIRILVSVMRDVGHPRFLDIVINARSTVEAIYDSHEKDIARLNLVRTLATAGLLHEASALAIGFKDEGKRVMALSTLAAALAQASHENAVRMFTEAKVATALMPPTARTEALYNIIDAMRQAGWFSEAKQIASTIDDLRVHASALSTLAQLMWQTDHQGSDQLFVESHRLAKQIADNWARSEAFRIIATNLAKAGSIEKAKDIADTISDAYSRTMALHMIAQTLVQSHMFTEAQEIIGFINHIHRRPDTGSSPFSVQPMRTARVSTAGTA
jgi:hypothetical protein